MLDYLIPIIFVLAAFVAIYKLKFFTIKGISKPWLIGAFALKLIAAFLMVSLYTNHYPDRSKADIFRYYDDAMSLHQLFPDHKADYFKLLLFKDSSKPVVQGALMTTNNWETHNHSSLFGSNRFIIRVNMVISLFALGAYGVHTVVFSFLAFLGLFWIFQFFHRELSQHKWMLFIIIFAFPSILFWSSGILKESLILFFIGLIINYGYYALKGKKPILRSLFIIIGFAFLFQTRAILSLLLIPMILAYLWNYLKPQRRSFLPYFILLFISISILTESKQVFGTDFYGILIEKRMAFEDLGSKEDAGSLIMSTDFTADNMSILKSTPIAMINSLFRPAPWEAKGPLMWAAALENILIFVLIVLVVVYPSNKIQNYNLLWFSLLFALSNLILVGLTTPILGAISRYRIIGLLFLLIAFVQLINFKKITPKALR